MLERTTTERYKDVGKFRGVGMLGRAWEDIATKERGEKKGGR